ncbi:hypothetical protein QZH41_010209 [Actinostola sp. cb2023]|nr:hypothetical protein QZH41_010209 [Actinostola sp. cb2023]
MRSDEITVVARNDELIKKVGEMLVVKHGGEASKMFVKAYLERPDWGKVNCEAILASLTNFEKELSKKLDMVETRGKRGRKVPVLLTPNIKNGIDLLIAKRKEVGIPDDNPYIFARSSKESLSHLRGWDCLSARQTKGNLDPMNGRTSKKITIASQPSLTILINKISKIADSKTRWGSSKWPCIEPVHYKQLTNDHYNCGVIICLFARCLCKEQDFNLFFNMTQERQRITSDIFGSCFNDVNERKAAICKECICDDGDDDWIGYDACVQFYHASCLDISYSEALSIYFTCP